jgi:hypothetical protein
MRLGRAPTGLALPKTLPTLETSFFAGTPTVCKKKGLRKAEVFRKKRFAD